MGFSRVLFRSRAHDRVDFGLELEPLGDLERGGAMMGEARMERAKAADRHIGIVRRYRPAGLVARGREQLGGVPLGRGTSREHVRLAPDTFEIGRTAWGGRGGRAF